MTGFRQLYVSIMIDLSNRFRYCFRESRTSNTYSAFTHNIFN